MTFQTETKVSSCLILTDKLEIPEKSKKKKKRARQKFNIALFKLGRTFADAILHDDLILILWSMCYVIMLLFSKPWNLLVYNFSGDNWYFILKDQIIDVWDCSFKIGF